MAGDRGAESADIKSLTNGELYDEWNEGCWARQSGKEISTEWQARLDAIYAEALSRPAEAA